MGAFLPLASSWFHQGVSLFGIVGLIGIAWLFSVNRRAISWRPVIWGVALQLVFALIVLTPALQVLFFDVVDGGVRRVHELAGEPLHLREPDLGGNAEAAPFEASRLSPPWWSIALTVPGRRLAKPGV